MISKDFSFKRVKLTAALGIREIESSSYKRDRITASILANLITKVNKKCTTSGAPTYLGRALGYTVMPGGFDWGKEVFSKKGFNMGCNQPITFWPNELYTIVEVS